VKNKTLKTFLAIAALSLVSVLVCQFSARPLWDVSDARWIWMKTRIFSPRQTLDYAVVGSSLPWRGIDPNVISEEMNGASAWNLARPWNGREADYFILKELLKRHDVKNVLTYFLDDEEEKIHPYAAHVISPSEAFAETAFYFENTRITEKEKVKERIKIITGYFANLSVRAYLRIFRGKESLDPVYRRTSDRANGYHVFDTKPDPIYIEEIAGATWRIRPGTGKPLPADSRAGFYLSLIGRLCAEYGANLYFVNIPIYKHPLPGPIKVMEIGRLGEVLLPDIRALKNKEYWFNLTHLNLAGGDLFTRNLVHLLKEGKEASPHFKLYMK